MAPFASGSENAARYPFFATLITGGLLHKMRPRFFCHVGKEPLLLDLRMLAKVVASPNDIALMLLMLGSQLAFPGTVVL